MNKHYLCEDIMTLLYSHNTPDDGYFKLYKTILPFSYDIILENIKNKVFDCNGYSVNSRHSGLFTSEQEQIGKSFCDEWEYVPKRYVYQEMPDILVTLMEIAQKTFPERKLREAIVNVYGKGDFIAYHKDYHKDNVTPVSVMCSFECDPASNHILEFYRTLDDPQTTRKDRSSSGYSLYIPLVDNSIAIMVGMQRRYVHSLHPGNKRISIVFR